MNFIAKLFIAIISLYVYFSLWYMYTERENELPYYNKNYDGRVGQGKSAGIRSHQTRKKSYISKVVYNNEIYHKSQKTEYMCDDETKVKNNIYPLYSLNFDNESEGGEMFEEGKMIINGVGGGFYGRGGQNIGGILFAKGEGIIKGESGEVEVAKEMAVLTCPEGYDFNEKLAKCGRIITVAPLTRCLRGHRRGEFCVDMIRPLSVDCPVGYDMRGYRCVRTETTLKQLACPPTAQHDGYHCVQIAVKEVGYVCEKGELGADGVCEVMTYEIPKKMCPPHFNIRDEECVKISYFPCTEKHKHEKTDVHVSEGEHFHPQHLNRHKPHHMRRLDISYKEEEMSNNVDNYFFNLKHNEYLRRLDDKKKKHSHVHPHPPPPPDVQVVETCWNKEMTIPMIECEHDGQLNMGVCMYKRVFPAIPKCSGYVKDGACMIEIRTRAKYVCPLNYREGGHAGNPHEQGLHSEWPYVVKQHKNDPDPHYADPHGYINKHGILRRLSLPEESHDKQTEKQVLPHTNEGKKYANDGEEEINEDAIPFKTAEIFTDENGGKIQKRHTESIQQTDTNKTRKEKEMEEEVKKIKEGEIEENKEMHKKCEEKNNNEIECIKEKKEEELDENDSKQKETEENKEKEEKKKEKEKKEENAKTRNLFESDSIGRLHPAIPPLIATLPVDTRGKSSHVIEYVPTSANYNKHLHEKEVKHMEQKKKMQSIKDEILQEKPLKHMSPKEAGYCFRETVAAYTIKCPHDFIPHPEMKTCMHKSKPILVCEKGFSLNEHKGICSKIEYVPAIKVIPSSVISCKETNGCEYLQLSSSLGYITQKENVKLIETALKKEEKKHKHEK